MDQNKTSGQNYIEKNMKNKILIKNEDNIIKFIYSFI